MNVVNVNRERQFFDVGVVAEGLVSTDPSARILRRRALVAAATALALVAMLAHVGEIGATTAAVQEAVRDFLTDDAGAGDITGYVIGVVVTITIVASIVFNATVTAKWDGTTKLVTSFFCVGIAAACLTRIFKSAGSK